MNVENPGQPSSIYIISGSVGASGEQVVHTLLAQFPNSHVPVITVPHIRHAAQLEEVVSRVEAGGGLIVHTLVDANLRNFLIGLAQQRRIPAIDLVGDLLSRLAEVIGEEPAGHPGLYRRLNRDYFERITAIEYAITHDDGKKPEDWPLAEIVLVGVSRVGKTPLSMYLAVLGWKVANMPLVLGLSRPSELAQLDKRRVFGLTIEPGQLLPHRQKRQRRLGATGPSIYTEPARIYEEVEAAHRLFQENGYTVIDVTDKPIETSADEIIETITRRF